MNLLTTEKFRCKRKYYIKHAINSMNGIWIMKHTIVRMIAQYQYETKHAIYDQAIILKILVCEIYRI